VKAKNKCQIGAEHKIVNSMQTSHSAGVRKQTKTSLLYACSILYVSSPLHTHFPCKAAHLVNFDPEKTGTGLNENTDYTQVQ